MFASRQIRNARTVCVVLVSVILCGYYAATYTRRVDVQTGRNVALRLFPNQSYRVQLKDLHDESVIHLSTIGCEAQADSLKVLVKSAILMSSQNLVFHIIADEKLSSSTSETFKMWSRIHKGRFKYRFLRPTYPQDVDEYKWKDMNKPCSSLKLFLPTILKDIDSTIYLDIDTIFLRPPEDLWAYFRQFSTQQTLGVSYDNRMKEDDYVPQRRVVPEHIPSGVEPGVMLLNLTRLRKFDWKGHVLRFYKHFHERKISTQLINFGTQLVNIILYFNPHHAFTLDCDWNFRPPLLENKKKRCERAEKTGASILHGSLSNTTVQPTSAFSAVYTAYKQLNIDANRHQLLAAIKKNVDDVLKDDKHELDRKRSSLFYKRLDLVVKKS